LESSALKGSLQDGWNVVAIAGFSGVAMQASVELYSLQDWMCGRLSSNLPVKRGKNGAHQSLSLTRSSNHVGTSEGVSIASAGHTMLPTT
jgi:hypothetical protein